MPDSRRRQSSPRVLQTGTYSSWNKGDAAMQASTAIAIRQRWPGADVVIGTPFPGQDEPFYAGIARTVPCARRRFILASCQIARASLWRLAHDLAGRAPNWLIADAELRATFDADLVVDLSGDMLTDDYGPHVAWSHYIPIINAMLLGRPVFICAQSIGPFRWTGWIARQILRRAAAVTVRDAISQRYLESLGFGHPPVELTADMAFLLEPQSIDRVDEILAMEKISLGTGPVLGVSVSRIIEARYAEVKTNDQDGFVQMLATVLDDFARDHRAKVLFVSHVTGPTAEKDDRGLSAAVAAAMRTPADVIYGDYRPEELKGVISRCSLFVGARMHANIAALSSGVPVVALSYSHKTAGIMAQFGQSAFVIEGRQLSRPSLQQKLADAWAARDDTAVALRQVFIELRTRALRNIDTAATLMSEGRRLDARAG